MQKEKTAYIAGLMDGEACFAGHVANAHKNYSTGGSIDFRITVQATSILMIDTLKDFYEENNIAYSIQTPRWMPSSTRPAYRIDVGKKKDVEKLLNILIPYLKIKKPEAEVILGWIEFWGYDMRGANGYKIRDIPTKRERKAVLSKLSRLKHVA